MISVCFICLAVPLPRLNDQWLFHLFGCPFCPGKWVCDECTRDGVVAEELERKEIERQQEREREWEQQSQNHPPSLPIAPANIKQGWSQFCIHIHMYKCMHVNLCLRQVADWLKLARVSFKVCRLLFLSVCVCAHVCTHSFTPPGSLWR